MSTPESKLRAWDFVVATIIATALFSSLAVAIKIKPHETASGNSTSDAGIFAIEPDPAKNTQAHAQLVKWLEFKDPTHVTLPPEEGLNRDHPSRNWIYRDSEFFGKKNSLPPVDFFLAEQAPYEFETRLPAPPPQDFGKELASQHLTRVRFPLPPPTPPTPEAGVYWLDEQSRTITEIPAMADDLPPKEGRIVTGPTILMTTPLGSATYQPRVSVDKSCGDRALDLIAFKHLARWLRRLTVQKSNPLRESWLMTPRKIAVVWRHVPGITYTLPKETIDEPETNEPDAG